MDLESLFLRLPIVYTTRLDEMTVFKKDLSKSKFKDVIEVIIIESMPLYKTNNCNDNVRIYKTEPPFDEHLNNYEENNELKSQHLYCQRKQNCKIKYENLKLKIEKIIRNSKDYNNQTEVIIKSEIDTNSNNYTHNRLKNLLALCKPLKIVLKDINKVVQKTNNAAAIEVLNISSDSDDDPLTIGQGTIIDRKITINNATPNGRTITRSADNHIVKSKNDLKDILRQTNLQNSVIVLYNLYLKEFDSYQIDKLYNVTEYKTRKYTEVYKFPMKTCKLIINIITCCWRNRNSYVLLLLSYKKYNNIAKFIDTTHPCKKRCLCCCLSSEPPFKGQDVNKITRITAVNESLLNKSGSTFNASSKLITYALKFQRNTKYKGYPVSDLNYENKNIYARRKRLIQIYNNHTGVFEFYEFGCDNLIYSKVIHNGFNDSCWLLNTFQKIPNSLNVTVRDTVDREKIIMTFRHDMNIISFDTECFLRIPMTVSEKLSKKQYHNPDKVHINSYIIKHTRSFVGDHSKRSKVVSIVSQIRKMPVRHVALPKNRNRYSIPPAHLKPASKKSRKTLGPNIMEEEVAQNINCLIKDILHRFRNVLLTINDQGKVAAALNAPLSSLTQSELTILSQILNHAQNQVDKLGLTPGTCLNPDTPMLINSSLSKTSISSTEAINSEKSDGHKKMTFKEQRRNTNSTLLSNFSTIIGNKKHEYEKSFRSYLGDTFESTPKITDVFSLNNVDGTSSDILKSPLQDNNVINDNGSIISTESAHRISPTIFVEEIKEEITIIDNEIDSIGLKERKRKTSLNCNTEPPRVRVKTTTEILVDDPVTTSFKCEKLENV